MQVVSTLPASRLGSRVSIASAGAAGAAAVSYLALVDPSKSGSKYLFCPLNAVTGLYCPLCGSTRAVHQLLNGHLDAAFGFNQLFVLALPFIAYAVAVKVSPLVGGPSLRSVQLSNRAMWMLGAVMFTYAVLRNLPFETFRVLAP